MHNEFIKAIHSKKLINLSYRKKDGTFTSRKCAPLDFGPHKRYPNKGDLYHIWDFEGSNGPHVSSLEADQINSLEVLSEEFEPDEFVNWSVDWSIPRNWGAFS